MTADQLTRADVERLAREGRHAEIDAAREAGRLAVLLGSDRPLPPDHLVTGEDVKRLYGQRRYTEIEELRQAGRLNHLLDPDTTNQEK